MSSFIRTLWVTPLEDGKCWALKNTFTYHIGSEHSRRLVRVPEGFITDFASVPRMFFFLPDWATYSKSPVIHDYLYHEKKVMGKPITRKEADKIFLEAMLIDFRKHGFMGKLIAITEYIAVRGFGSLVWRSKNATDK